MAEKLTWNVVSNEQKLRDYLENPEFPGDIEVVGDVDIGAATIQSGTQTIAAGGTTTAANLAKSYIEVGADAGGDIVTVANGTTGQRMTFVCVDATGTTTITPATFNGGTSVTFDAVGDSIEIQYGSLGWSIIGGNSYTIVP
jgi:hypothetical protein